MSAMMRGVLPKITLSLCLLLLSGTGCAELDRIFGQPFVTISSPTNGEIIQSNTVTVEGMAEDGVGVVRLVYELQNANGRSGERDVFAFYSTTSQAFSFEITDLTPGSNTISVVAYDGDSYRHQASVSITVNGEDTKPFDIVFTTPEPDFTTIGSTVAVAGTILDTSDDPAELIDLSYVLSNSDGKGKAVDVFADYDATAGEFAFSAEDLLVGRNTITLKASDRAGNFVEADITVTVEEPTPVALTLTSPAQADVIFIYGKTLALGGDLGGNVPVTELTYVLDEGDPVDILSTLTESRQFVALVADLEAGDHAVEVSTMDALKNTAKASVTLKVIADVAPVSLALSSDDLDIAEGESLNVNANIGAAQALASVRYHFGDATAAITVPADAITVDAEASVEVYPLAWGVAFSPDLTGVAAGTVTMTVIAQDIAGNEVSTDLKFTLAGEVIAACGDALISDGEACDGTQLNGMSCVDFGFAEGALGCSATCTLETTACTGASFIGVGVGMDAACGLLGDHKVNCWGFDAFPRNGQFTAFGFGNAGLCAVRLDSTLSCYGVGLNAAPDELFSDVVVARVDICATQTSGATLCWPAMAADGSATFSNPSGEALTHLTAAADSDIFCGLLASGAAECWDRVGAQPAPADLLFSDLSAGGNTFCGLSSEGGVSCWKGDLAIPADVPNAEPLTAIAIGNGHRCGLTLTGAALCWGDDTVGQLDAPADVVFKALAASGDNTCGINAADGQVVCWGPAAASGTLPVVTK
jgi:hypothetical protein